MHANAFMVMESHLSLAQSQDEESPLMIYNQTFSRFKCSVKNKQANGWSTANISIRDIPDILERSDFAFQQEMLNEIKPQAEGKSPGYTVRFKTGWYKGKTPVEVLLENPANRDGLVKQGNFLYQHLKEFPKNQIEMDAIKDALNLLDSGELAKMDQGESASPAPIKIYTPGPRPLQRKKRADGMCFIYDMSIVWTVGQQYPIEFRVANYYAPVLKRDTGTLNVMVSKMDPSSKLENVIKMSASEWISVTAAIKRSMHTFENIYAPTAYRDAIETDKRNRKVANAGYANAG